MLLFYIFARGSFLVLISSLETSLLPVNGLYVLVNQVCDGNPSQTEGHLLPVWNINIMKNETKGLLSFV